MFSCSAKCSPVGVKLLSSGGLRAKVVVHSATNISKQGGIRMVQGAAYNYTPNSQLTFGNVKCKIHLPEAPQASSSPGRATGAPAFKPGFMRAWVG